MDEGGAVAGAAAGAEHRGASRGLKFFPADPQQTLRVRRYLIAAGTSLLVPAAFFLAYALGLMPMALVLQGTALVVGLIVLFYLLFRLGLNLRAADPSLTAEMIGSAILVLAWIMYQAPAMRDSLSLFYLVALLFGVLRLHTKYLLAIAAIALAAHSTVVLFSYLRDPHMDLRVAYTQLAVLFIVLPWFATMGGYVNSLRRRLTDSNRELREANGRIEQLAIRDELTGVYNRRFLMDALRRETSRSDRLDSPFSACLFDIDHFKSINDKFGHAAGDAVLKQIALIAGPILRGVDVFGRYGGEEFLIILPDTAQRGACALAERVRSSVASSGFPLVPADHRVAVTVGVATSRRGESVLELLARADAGLYRGKEAGRDRVVGVG